MHNTRNDVSMMGRGDAFFSEAQQARLQDLKSRRDALTPDERAEMEALITAAFGATVARTQALPLVISLE